MPLPWQCLDHRVHRSARRTHTTIAVATDVGGASKLLTIPPIETGKADALNDSNIWPRAMTIIGSQDSRTSTSALGDGVVCVFMAPSPSGESVACSIGE